jgi:8-oxo-dGTP pyrophosphatase MutT (NUDIX family)
MARRDGDGFVRCTCGESHWGLHGAAGLLVVRTDVDEPSVLLQRRAEWTHGGGTWALPGGARDSHEDFVTAALREAEEEVGADHSRLDVRTVFADDHGNWRYDTVIAFAHDDAGVFAANYETSGLEWVALPLVDTYDLHPGLAAHWTAIAEMIRRELTR